MLGRIAAHFGRSLTLRCPACGKACLYRGLFRMHPTCPNCGIDFNREPGFYLGSIYFNYGVTAVFTTFLFMYLKFFRRTSSNQALGITVAVAIVLPILLFHHARAFWLSFDQLYDPQISNNESDG